jgi:hypothetical protein
MHQHAPAGAQVNSVPQAAQDNRRGVALSKPSVMSGTEATLLSSCLVHLSAKYSDCRRSAQYSRDDVRQKPGLG